MQLTEKAVYFRQVIHQDFDPTGISRFVLGSYWRVASPAERRQFRSLFVDRLVRFHGRQLAQSGDGEPFVCHFSLLIIGISAGL
jgi:ABC-type transporter MlaC component